MRLLIATLTAALLGMLAGLVATWISIPTTVAPESPDRCCAALMVVPPLFGSVAGGAVGYYRRRYRGALEAAYGRKGGAAQWRR